MKKLFFVAMIAAATAILAFVLSFQPVPNAYAADGCYICKSGSSADQCKYHGDDTFDQRKKCEAAGCKVGGTTSCSTAANVKVIDPN
ncbi:MAG: hypothetical protein A2176_06545 [Spirochaetes bacterium RBG_13_51_14]|nr:MAG: hypothetical protein A2176_06545 [Spirochaetes bacterium RBG_13_51_14]